MTATAFSKMPIIWIVAIFLLAVSCRGQPVIEVVQLNSENVTALPVIEEKQQLLVNNTAKNDDLTNQVPVRTEETHSASVFFVDMPQHTETQLGSSILLACRTANPVAECQWSWQPLPPVHLPLPDISDSSTESAAISTSSVSPTPGPVAHPLPVRRFPAFGNNSNDCSVRFSSTKHEQIGYWTCAARNSMNDPFTSTEPAKLTIINDQQGSAITFVKQVKAIEVVTGSSAQIPCKTKQPVRECQWFWRRLNESQSSNVEIKKFAVSQHDNTDCSIQLKNVLSEQEGYWTCGARIDSNSSFVRSNAIRLLISEVEFVQLSRGVQVAAGESVLLRCLVNKPVMRCEWSWRATNSSKEPFLLKKFIPNKDGDHDCSVRFKNILYEEEGLWTCGIRLSSDGILHEAPATTVSLLPSSKVNIVEMPSNTTVPLGTEVTLKCITSSRVEKCTWSWKPLQCNSPEIVMHEFPSNGDLGRDCSLTLPHVRADEQGQWSCQVSISSLNTVLSSPFARLLTFEQDEVKFSELSKDIQISSGGTILLRCVTSTPVEQCRWSLTPVNSNTTVVVKQFPAAGNEARDCSVRLSHALAEQEGLWTCGARAHGRQNYTDAPPAKLSLLEPEPVSVALWAAPHQKITLACRVKPISPEVQCHWFHAPNVQIYQNTANTTKKDRHNLQMDYFTGICTIEFKPDHTDLGQWICRFTSQKENAEVELGSTTLVLFNTQADPTLGWIVGSLTAVILFLMIIVVVLVVCKNRFFISRSPEILETLPSSKKRQCHSENSNKIDIQLSGCNNYNEMSTP